MQKRAHREHKPGVMENAETARKATLVFCISCRQRELKCRTAKAALALPRDALQGQRAPKLVLQKATLPTGTPETQPRASPDPYAPVVPEQLQTCGLPARELLWDGGKARTRAPELDHRCHLGRGAAKPLGWSKWEVRVAERGSKHGWTLLQLWAGAPREQEGSRRHLTQSDRGACGTTSGTPLVLLLPPLRGEQKKRQKGFLEPWMFRGPLGDYEVPSYYTVFSFSHLTQELACHGALASTQPNWVF